MSSELHTDPPAKPSFIELRPAISTNRDAFHADAMAADRVVVQLDAPGPQHRGRLAAFIQEQVEDRLQQKGAAPTTVGATTSVNALLCDQLHRARLIGASGIAVAFQDLAGVADRSGILDPDDSATLRWWLRATDAHPVQLLLPASIARLRAYERPVSVSSWLPGETYAVIEYEPETPELEPGLSASTQVMELALSKEMALSDAVIQSVALDSESQAEQGAEPPAALTLDTREPESRARMHDEVGVEFKIAFASAAEFSPSDAALTATDAAAPEAPTALESKALSRATTAPVPPPPPRARRAALSTDADPETEAPAPKLEARRRELEGEVHMWMRELASAEGPKPLGAIERLFVSAYVPLAHAVAEGIGGEEAREALLAWSHSFETSYPPAFEALRQRGKRPTMVVDVPDIARRLGRLHGARQVQLLLVDGMRFDLGQLVRQKLKSLSAGTAACAEQLLLWSSLPTCTAAALEVIGRGPGGMHEFTGEVDEQQVVTTGDAARRVRRLRTGPHELFKLDVVEDLINTAGSPLKPRLDEIAETTAGLIADHMRTLPSRTLLMVFGDHGFQMEQRGSRTKSATQGGATPEEVFVPAYAWVTENVH